MKFGFKIAHYNVGCVYKQIYVPGKVNFTDGATGGNFTFCYIHFY